MGWALPNVKVNWWNYKAPAIFLENKQKFNFVFYVQQAKIIWAPETGFFLGSEWKKIAYFFRNFGFSSIHFHTRECPPLVFSSLISFFWLAVNASSWPSGSLCFRSPNVQWKIHRGSYRLFFFVPNMMDFMENLQWPSKNRTFQAFLQVYTNGQKNCAFHFFAKILLGGASLGKKDFSKIVFFEK